MRKSIEIVSPNISGAKTVLKKAINIWLLVWKITQKKWWYEAEVFWCTDKLETLKKWYAKDYNLINF